ncbi:GntR family transcriptional regulator [Sphingobium yanoikuyae]|uniref:GntR family transcriptional regulator n=1 Tax=Sphingobium yanoikuyae TaxID=13690 RepID=UPI0026E92E46|nr:GntR family transcriptional regulator [Sphingobium yanoikuyae]
MNSGLTAERVYDAIRAQILDRAYVPGTRLEPAQLAKDLAASMTPVRDALHRLMGESLVEARTGSGFHLPLLDEPSLIDLYRWSHELILLALRQWAPEPSGAAPPAALIDRAEALFDRIARGSDNGEHRRAMQQLAARLHAIRQVEPQALPGVEEELGYLEEGLDQRDKRRFLSLLGAYHRRRSRAAGAILRALYRSQ